jgi:hypothetical protein
MFHLAIIKKPLQKIEGALMSAVWTACSVLSEGFEPVPKTLGDDRQVF